MTSKEAAIHWRALARRYHDLGMNIVPLGSDKHPVITGIGTNGAPLRFKWEAWQDAPQAGKLFDGILSPSWWADVRGVAALAGPVSGWLIVVDGDHAPIETARKHLPLLGLPDGYKWFNPSGSGDGWHCYVRCPDWRQDLAKVQRNAIGGGHVELRWKGTCTALPGSHHPSGNIYPGEPKEAPQVVTAAALQAFFDAITIAPSKATPKPSKAPTPTHTTSSGNSPYGLRALAGAVDKVRAAREGARNDELNRQAKPLGELCAGGELDRAHVEAELTAAALDAGLGEKEILATLRSALDAGEREPRTAPESERTTSSYSGDATVTGDDAAAILEGEQATRFAIDVDQQTSSMVKQALQAIIRANEQNPAHPVLYVRAGALARVIVDENGRATIETVERGALLAILADVADWVAISSKGEFLDRDVPLSLVLALLNQASWPGLPILEGVATHPVFGRNGELHDKPGYDPKTRIYNAASVQLGNTEPTPDAVQNAVRLFLDDLLTDFPFVDQASRAHALALALLPVCRYMIDGATPLHLISAPTHGAGKSLLAECALLPAYGREPAATPEARSSEEWGKLLTSVIMAGSQVVFLDNVARPLEGSGMATALTQSHWSDRLLGVNRTIDAPIRNIWLATAKNPVTSPEIARRCCLIRIDPNMEHPEDRTGFKHPHLKRWIREHRAELLSAAICLVRNWVAKGRPLWKGQRKGSYEAWGEVMGGILDAAGVAGFLANEQVMRESAPETVAMIAFVEAWHAKFGERHVSAKDLWPIAGTPDDEKEKEKGDFQNLLAGLLGDRNERSRRTKLGTILRKNVDAVFAGFKICAAKDELDPTKDKVDRDGGRLYCLSPVGSGRAEPRAKVPRVSPEVEAQNAEPAEPQLSHAYAGAHAHTHTHVSRVTWGSAGSANDDATRGSTRGTSIEGSALAPYLGRILAVSELQDAVAIANAENVKVTQLPTAGGWKIDLA